MELYPFKTPAGKYKKKDIISTVTQVYDYVLNQFQHFEVSRFVYTVNFFFGLLGKLQIIYLMDDHQKPPSSQMLVYPGLNVTRSPDYLQK
jgi:hypothetical protein